MPSDYAQISRENLEEYGHNRTGWREDLLVDLYPDRTHFVFELLQNAEDALGRPNGTGGSGRVSFVLTHDAVHFSHYGDPFTTDDVRGVCAIARRAKERDLTAIGRFGIGFKSVYAITDLPEVHSGDEHFTVEDYVCPAAVPPVELAEGETVIVLPLKENAEADNIARQFESLGEARTLLFLREINEIVWSAEGGRSGSHRREEEVEADGVRRVGLFSETEGEDREEEAWLVFSREVHHERKSAGYVELAFRTSTDDDGSEAIHVIGDSPLAAFFPTVIETHLGMLVQGPYRTTPSRETIPRDDAWNRYLVGETASLLVDALRDCRLITPHVFDALPLSRSRFSGGFFEPMFDAVREAVASEPLLPAHRGGYVAALQARLTDEPGLRNLVSRRQLAELLGQDEPVAWLAPEITRDETRDLHRYLTDEHGVRELDTEGLLQRLGKPFIEAQPDRWILRLYEFLARGDLDSYDYLLALDDVPLIRLEDSTHIAWHWGEPVAFLPTEPPSGFPNTVHPAVCESTPAREFLKSIGVTEPDQVDKLVRSVIPRYRNQEVTKKSVYAIDVRRIADILGAASRERRGRLVEALRETPFVRVVDAGTGERSFVRPEDAYLATKQLRDLFEGVPSALLVDRSVPRLGGEAMSDLLEECGASRTLKPIVVKRPARQSRFTDAELRRMREATRWKNSTGRGSVTDYELRGLEALLEYLVDLPLEEAETRAERLWGVLRESSGSRQWTRGRYEWHYYTSRSRGFESTAVRLLNNTAWVPDGSGGRRPPNRVEFAPLGWTRDAFLESIIKFRRPEPSSEVAVLAKAADVDRGALEAVKEAQDAGLSPEAIRQTLRREARRQRILADPSPRVDDGSWGVGANGNGERAAEGATSGADAADDGHQVRDPADEPSSGGERVFESYIRVVRESVATEEGRREQARRTGLEDDAIALIQKQEPSLKGTRRDNPGFDLYEAGEDGEPVRWVEVKAMSGRWESHAATLTPTQFGLAREEGEAYWLYVVEHAGTDGARIVGIQNPAGRDSTYTFDHGWRAAAEGTEGDD